MYLIFLNVTNIIDNDNSTLNSSIAELIVVVGIEGLAVIATSIIVTVLVLVVVVLDRVLQ